MGRLGGRGWGASRGWFAVAVVSMTVWGTVSAQAEQYDFSPFHAFWGTEGVVLSGDLHRIWLSVVATEFRVKMPRVERVLEESEDHVVALGAECRAQAEAEANLFPGSGVRGELFLERHPDAEDAATLFSSPARHLWLELTGGEYWRDRVKLVLNGTLMEGVFLEPRTDYSAPGASGGIPLDGTVALEVLLESKEEVLAELMGEDMAVRARFPVPGSVLEAAAAMVESCPVGVETEGK